MWVICVVPTVGNAPVLEICFGNLFLSDEILNLAAGSGRHVYRVPKEIGVSVRSEAPTGKCVVAPIVARAARGATGGDERAFGVDMARA